MIDRVFTWQEFVLSVIYNLKVLNINDKIYHSSEVTPGRHHHWKHVIARGDTWEEVLVNILFGSLYFNSIFNFILVFGVFIYQRHFHRQANRNLFNFFLNLA